MSCLNPEQVQGTFLAGPLQKARLAQQRLQGAVCPPLQLDVTGTSLSPLVSSL